MTYSISMESLLANLKPPFPNAFEMYQSEIRNVETKWIVLDDDPTGTQTVNNVSVYTHWDEESIRAGFNETKPLFFILTNSRGMTESETIKTHKEIAERVVKVAQETGKEFHIISRSDSTLRGHYPTETETLKEVLEKRLNYHFDGEVICPFFPQGGRYTYNNIHYVCVNNVLVPVGETEFAKEKTFGYKSSDLGEWIEEKTKGKYLAADQCYIDINDLRNGDIEKLTEQLNSCENFQKVIVNAISYEDLYVFAKALLMAEKNGKHFLYRTAASFPEVMGNIKKKTLLCGSDLIDVSNKNGGLIVVGSYVKKTTEQLMKLLEVEDIVDIPFKSSLVIEPKEFEQEVKRVQDKANALIHEGKNVVIYTERKVLTPNSSNPEDALLLSLKIADAVTSFVRNLQSKPKFIIAKGGITSSDVAVNGLGINKATVLGQILKGIPVWLTGNESKYPHTPYIIFPGNVGDQNALKEVVQKLI